MKTDDTTFADGSKWIELQSGCEILFNRYKENGWFYDNEANQWEFFADCHRMAWLTKHADFPNYFWPWFYEGFNGIIKNNKGAMELFEAKSFAFNMVDENIHKLGVFTF